MGKRKGVPQRASEEKRQCLSWNMQDEAGPSGSLTIIHDQNASLLHEIQEQEKDHGIITGKKCAAIDGENDDSFRSKEVQRLFEELLEDCLFYVPLATTVSSKVGEETYEFGRFHIQWCPGPHQTKPPLEYPRNSQCWLYVSMVQHRSMLYFEIEENDENVPSEEKQQKSVIFWCVDIDLPTEVLEGLESNKVFQVVFRDYSERNHCVSMSICGTSSLLGNLSFPSEAASRMTKAQQAIQTVVCHFNKITVEKYDKSQYTKKHNIQKLYDYVKSYHEKNVINHGINLQHPDLRPTLRRYQRNAVNWMLQKEGYNQTTDASEGSELHLLYEEIKTLDGKTLYFNKLAGSLVAKPPMRITPPPGGILADEMGLGKTVEMLACIMAHRRDNFLLPEPLPTLKLCNICQLLKGVEGGSQNNVDTEDLILEEYRKGVDFFECVCGTNEEGYISVNRRRKRKHRVRCVKCSRWQHAECVNYDLTDPYRGEFKCPYCHKLSPPVYSGATLIISPASICHQWIDEILKHVKKESLKVYVYKGVSKQGFVQPVTLAQQNIVITTYETLRKELYFAEVKPKKLDKDEEVRTEKKYMALPSPIAFVDWWRICLDEAQMVESATAKSAEMARKLHSVNRWCATGTPIQKGIEDLYGLLLFLELDPYFMKCWFDKLLYRPLCHGIERPMYDVISQVLWRTVKKDVIDQVDIPEQTDHVHWLKFSPVEDHFYRRQYDTSINDSLKRLSKWTDPTVKLSSLDRNTLNQVFYLFLNINLSKLMADLLYPLLRLRQACCHPQAVRGEFIPLHLRKTAMTMEELLESLVKKATIECEEAHRLLVAAFNGLAGWHIIKHQYPEAVDMYREVLRSIEEHKDRFRTDELQLLHALYNLKEVLSFKPEGVHPTLRDGQLEEQIGDIRKKYILKSKSVVHQCQEQLAPLKADIRQHKKELKQNQNWWLGLVQEAISRDLDTDLVDHVREEVDKDKGSKVMSISRSFRSCRGLELVIRERLVAMETSYETVQERVNKLSEEPSQDLINEATDCCLRPVGKIKATCPFCKTSDLFDDYESKLFSFSEQGVTSEIEGEYSVSTKRQGTWADSDVEKALKAILGFAKMRNLHKELIEIGHVHIKLMDSLKKEFKPFRNLWIELKAYVASFDEINMATTRLRLRLPDEQKPDNQQLNIIEPAELEHHKLKLISDRTIAQSELRKKLGQQLYLKKLAEAQNGSENTENPDPCPVCQKALGKEWSVLHCGHCYCLDCIRILCEQYSFGGRNRVLTCALCRERTYHSDISYVSTIKKKTEVNDLNVKGSYSSKIQGIAKCLKQIQHDDPGAKALVFSTWADVLSLISQALDENGISHRTLESGTKFQKNLTAFKEDEHVTTLLLPIHSGANGLNLIEASYVLLVEPVLNPAQELQAIGRIHRIGQTKSTQVHRFLIKGTIEEKMYAMLRTFEMSASSHDMEENVLTIGDITNLLREDRDEDSEDVNEAEDEESSQGNHQESEDFAMDGEVTGQAPEVLGSSGSRRHREGMGASETNESALVTEEVPGAPETCESALVTEEVPGAPETCESASVTEEVPGAPEMVHRGESSTLNRELSSTTESYQGDGLTDSLSDPSENSQNPSSEQITEEEVVSENFSIQNGVFELH